MLRYGLPLLVFGVILYFLFGGLSRDPRLVPSPLVGKPVPAFDLPQLHTPETRSSQADLGRHPDPRQCLGKLVRRLPRRARGVAAAR